MIGDITTGAIATITGMIVSQAKCITTAIDDTAIPTLYQIMGATKNTINVIADGDGRIVGLSL